MSEARTYFLRSPRSAAAAARLLTRTGRRILERLRLVVLPVHRALERDHLLLDTHTFQRERIGRVRHVAGFEFIPLGPRAIQRLDLQSFVVPTEARVRDVQWGVRQHLVRLDRGFGGGDLRLRRGDAVEAV